LLAQRYDNAFSDSSLIRPIQTCGRAFSAHHIYPVLINFATAGTTRAILMNNFIQHNIKLQVHYIPVTMQPFYQSLGFISADYPHANAYYAEAISLPLYVDLCDEQQDAVIALLLEFLQ
jgi:dTDP-4-amino-4,6-dideoxygalactose transaminase